MSKKRERGGDHFRSLPKSHRVPVGSNSPSRIIPRRPVNNVGESLATPGAGHAPEAGDYETELREGEVEQGIDMTVARVADSLSFLHLSIDAKLAEAKKRMGERTQEQQDHEAQFESEQHLVRVIL